MNIPARLDAEHDEVHLVTYYRLDAFQLDSLAGMKIAREIAINASVFLPKRSVAGKLCEGRIFYNFQFFSINFLHQSFAAN